MHMERIDTERIYIESIYLSFKDHYLYEEVTIDLIRLSIKHSDDVGRFLF